MTKSQLAKIAREYRANHREHNRAYMQDYMSKYYKTRKWKKYIQHYQQSDEQKKKHAAYFQKWYYKNHEKNKKDAREYAQLPYVRARRMRYYYQHRAELLRQKRNKTHK